MNDLEREIRNEIGARGPLPFNRFMDLALYHPVHGYYRRRRNPFGGGGDYYTSSQLQPVFGRLIAQQIADWEARLGAPSDFTVVELGAGRGETAREVRTRLPHARYIEVERASGALPERFAGVVFSNEFFDALPVHVVCFQRGGLKERFVGVSEDRLVWVKGMPSSPSLQSYCERYIPLPAPEQIAELNLEALKWVEWIARSLERGYVLTIDYGYTASELSGGRRFRGGSLLSYYRHAVLEDVLADPGERDITAHVNFTALIEHGRSLGLVPSPLQSQAQFLLSIGKADEFRSALKAQTSQEARRHRLLLKTLVYAMGETFRVLVQEKGVLNDSGKARIS